MLTKKQVIAYWILMILDVILIALCVHSGPLILVPLLLVSCAIQAGSLSLYYEKPTRLYELAKRFL